MSAPHLGSGTVVASKYSIRALLAFHGATATYQATDGQGAGVALKLLDPAIGQRADVMGELERVKAESAALSRLGVLPVVDSGYDPATSAPFLVSEYMSIPSLARLLENGPLSEQVVQLILQGMATALDAAHSRGLFHHCLKPTDVFVGPAPSYPVLVADFGARVVQAAVPSQEAYASAAPWLAPEQLHGAVTPSAHPDVYSVALIAFYALTGRPYWLACQSNPVDLPALQQEALQPLVPLSRRAQELGRQWNPALDAPLARALAASPGERPASVGQLVQSMWPSAAPAAALSAPQMSQPGYAPAPQPSTPGMMAPAASPQLGAAGIPPDSASAPPLVPGAAPPAAGVEAAVPHP
ncbi:MAG: hypothetical protein JRI23_13235, partial [Deltaproteobacteria bacterium]|nr:hypothetical protein [Deltaproteobacteria bacterium]MBW2532687.1 hypothetical protein [Deltaproteobacteria bacterium]